MTELSVASQNALIQTNMELTMQLKAKQRRIEFLEGQVAQLESRLEQRMEVTVKTYDKAVQDESCRKVLILWLEASPKVGFTYEEAIAAFEKRWRYPCASVPQRMRDLRQQDKLYSKEVDGKVTFFLKLEGSN